jgi:hypothetical protein
VCGPRLLASTLWFPSDGNPTLHNSTQLYPHHPRTAARAGLPTERCGHRDHTPTPHLWRARCGKSFGGHSARETPGHIPNPEAKTRSADGTAGATLWESRTPPDIISKRAAQGWAALFGFTRRSMPHASIDRTGPPSRAVLFSFPGPLLHLPLRWGDGPSSCRCNEPLLAGTR